MSICNGGAQRDVMGGEEDRSASSVFSLATQLTFCPP